jgi:hypothetical protein
VGIAPQSFCWLPAGARGAGRAFTVLGLPETHFCCQAAPEVIGALISACCFTAISPRLQPDLFIPHHQVGFSRNLFVTKELGVQHS